MSAPDITFAGNAIDRATAVRTDAVALTAALHSAQARFVALWRQRCLVDQAGAVLLDVNQVRAAGADPDRAILLGRRAPEWLFAVQLEPSAPPAIGPAQRFAELREVMSELSGDDASLIAYARAMLNWRDGHAHCGLCGAPNEAREAGFVMACSDAGCGHRSFPRLDPAIIVLVHHHDLCLLGRQPNWPAGRFSTIAGFVEPGESLEDAVRREVLEETNVGVVDCRYFASQPWPFPAALMIGFHAAAASTDIALNDGELAAARWVSREEIVAGSVVLPPRTSVAFRLIESWFDAGGQSLRELGIEGPPLRLRR